MKGDDLANRLLDLAVACLRLATELEANAVGKHIARQLIRCSSSGGANYEEARSTESSADFVHKVAIAGKEVGETTYWLLLTRRAGLSTGEELGRWIDEGRQLVRILSASARTHPRGERNRSEGVLSVSSSGGGGSGDPPGACGSVLEARGSENSPVCP